MRQVPIFQRIILFLIIIVDELGLWILLPVIAPLIAVSSKFDFALHLTTIQRDLLFGSILGVQPLLSILAAPLWGYLADHLGRQRILCICLGGTFLGYLLYYFSFRDEQLLLLLLARIIVGATTASQAIVQSMVAVNSDKTLKLNNIAQMACAMTIPIIIGPLLAGFFSDNHWVAWFNQATPFIVATGLSAVNLILFLVFFGKKLPEENISNFISLKKIASECRYLLKQERLLNLLLCFLCLELFWSLYFQTLPVLLAKNYHFDSLRISLFISYLGIAMVFSLAVVIKKLHTIWQPAQLLFMSLLLGFISMLPMVIAPQLSILVICAAPLAMSVGLAYACLITLLSNVVQPKQQGLLMGVTNALLALAFSLTGFFASALTSVSVRLPLFVCGLLVLGACCLNSMPVIRFSASSSRDHQKC